MLVIVLISYYSEREKAILDYTYLLKSYLYPSCCFYEIPSANEEKLLENSMSSQL